MKKHLPEIGESVFVARYGQPSERTRVVNRIGLYLLLENGLKIHSSDDRVGPRAWHIDGAAISMDS